MSEPKSPASLSPPPAGELRGILPLKIPTALLALPFLSQSLYLQLAARGGIADSLDQLSNWYGRCKASTISATKALIAAGLLTVIRTGHGKNNGISCRYQIPEELRS